jgi:hypothetical protein
MEAEIQPQDLELEKPCPACLLGRNKNGGDCSTCNGRGIVVTPLGLHIMAFVVNNAKAFRDGKL